MNDDIKTFRFQTIKYAIIFALIFEACSVPALGFSVPFICGLSAGTSVAVLGFIIMVSMSKGVWESGQKWMSSLGYLIRLPIYGVVFLVCIKVGGLVTAIGCLAGFLTTSVSALYVHGIKSRIDKRRT